MKSSQGLKFRVEGFRVAPLELNPKPFRLRAAFWGGCGASRGSAWRFMGGRNYV